MTSTGTYNWAPTTGDLVLNAFGRIGVRRTELTQQHLADAAFEAQLVQVQFGNRLPLWWRWEEYSISITADDATYDLPARTINLVAVYIRQTQGSQTIDRILSPISAYDYASFPQKDTSGQPTSYWFNKQIAPQITLWPVPDDTTTYTLKVDMLSQIQDISLPSGSTPDQPVRFYDAFVAELAARMALIYAPDRYDRMVAIAERVWNYATETDSDDGVAVNITPGLSSYYGR